MSEKINKTSEIAKELDFLITVISKMPMRSVS